MSEVCHRSGQKVYAADRPIRIGGLVFNPTHFTCKATGTKLTLRTAKIATDPETGANDVYLEGKQPLIKPNQVIDVITERVGAVPDANMRTTDRKFNVAGKAAVRGCTDADLGSGYGVEAVVVTNQTTVTKPPTTVNNINLMEKLHNGMGESSGLAKGKYTGAEGEAPTAE
jgi:hypothetical protein